MFTLIKPSPQKVKGKKSNGNGFIVNVFVEIIFFVKYFLNFIIKTLSFKNKLYTIRVIIEAFILIILSLFIKIKFFLFVILNLII